MNRIYNAVKKRRIPSNKNGFTLIELLVSIGIASLLGAAAVSIFISSSRVYSETIIQNEQQLIMDGVSNYLNSALRYSMGLETYQYDDSIPGDMTAIWCNDNKLYSSSSSPSASNALVFDFQTESNQLLDVRFSYDGGGILIADITVTAGTNASLQTTYTQSIRLLNLDFGFSAPSGSISNDAGIAFKN